MRLYIARHGETDWNKEKRIQGRVDMEMNANGILQVNAVAKGLSDVDFEAIYSSPLKRAVETAKTISGNKEIIIDEKIYEIGFGSLEGIEYGNIGDIPISELSESLKKVRCFFATPDEYVPVEGGESYDSLIRRAKSFLEDLKSRYKGNENILVVSHATFIHMFISIIEKIPLSKLWSEIHIPNCSVSVIECLEEECKVLELGKVF